jgi:hypothetical protein
MGQVWLTSMPDWLDAAGLDVDVYDKNWTTRSRSSGGYEAVRGIGIHHDASSINSTEMSGCDWGWKNSSDRPIGCIRLWRNGHIIVGAAGATNTMGKGGPLASSKGTIPLDQGNLYMVAIEAANNGVGEAWSTPMLDAYIAMVWTLCDKLGLQHTDVWSHAGYCQPSCAGRKIDPAGPTPGYPNLGGTSGSKTWPDAAFRAYLDQRSDQTHPPEPEPEPPTTTYEGNMLFITRLDSNPNLIMIGDGINARRIRSDETDELTKALAQGTGPQYHDPTQPNRPVVRDIWKIPTMDDDWQQVLGLETQESLDQPG